MPTSMGVLTQSSLKMVERLRRQNIAPFPKPYTKMERGASRKRNWIQSLKGVKRNDTMESMQNNVVNKVWGFLKVEVSRKCRMRSVRAKLLSNMCTLGKHKP